MGNDRKLGAAVAGTLALLLGASAAQAIPTVIVDNGNVIRIENLDIRDQFGTETIYNVDFINRTANILYGPDGQRDFDFFDADDTALALGATMNILNISSPTPSGAGSGGSDQFFIGAEEEDLGRITAFGAEFFDGLWDPCNQELPGEQCLAGVAVLDGDLVVTYASYTVVPEPGTALLLGLGLAGLGVGRSKREEGKATA